MNPFIFKVLLSAAIVLLTIVLAWWQLSTIKGLKADLAIERSNVALVKNSLSDSQDSLTTINRLRAQEQVSLSDLTARYAELGLENQQLQQRITSITASVNSRALRNEKQLEVVRRAMRRGLNRTNALLSDATKNLTDTIPNE